MSLEIFVTIDTSLSGWVELLKGLMGFNSPAVSP